jgi:hypothetical protein
LTLILLLLQWFCKSNHHKLCRILTQITEEKTTARVVVVLMTKVHCTHYDMMKTIHNQHLALLLFLFSTVVSSLPTSSSSTSIRRLQEKPFPPSAAPQDNVDWQLPEWAQDWVEETLGDVDWSSPTALQDLLDGMMGRIDMDGLNDICPLLETAIGMGQAFGIAANCVCNGDLMTSLTLACSFQECLPVADIIEVVTTERQSNPIVDNAICGNVGLNFTFGNGGSLAASVCADFPDQLFQDTCFSYSMSLVDNSVTESCAASYGKQDCDCAIDGLCLNVNCSSVLPGAAMDTCQWLKMDTQADFLSWIPQWDIFDPDFVLNADMIPWQGLDWDQMDWANFNVSAIEWSNQDWLAESWTNLVGNVNEGVSEGVCTFLETAVSLTEQLGAKGSCKCGTTVSDGLVIDCDFSEICVDNTVGGLAPSSLCASVNMTLNYDKLSGVENKVCMDFKEDIHPQTCFSYTIPFADQNMTHSCSATYGDDQCTCSIDENFCIIVDCSEFEETATMNTCQVVDIGGAVAAERLMLPFQIPAEPQEPEEEIIEVSETSGQSDATPISSQLVDGDDSAAFLMPGGRIAALASFSIIYYMFAIF